MQATIEDSTAANLELGRFSIELAMAIGMNSQRSLAHLATLVEAFQSGMSCQAATHPFPILSVRDESYPGAFFLFCALPPLKVPFSI